MEHQIFKRHCFFHFSIKISNYPLSITTDGCIVMKSRGFIYKRNIAFLKFFHNRNNKIPLRPSIYKPLEIIFNQCLETGIFPSEWKKGNIVPIHKKGNKQMVQNYRPVSLLPICGKILERLMLNEMFEFFIENKLISSSQSGFKPGDSCINQLLSITHEVYSSFDKGLEVRSIFLDIAKAFDKV